MEKLYEEQKHEAHMKQEYELQLELKELNKNK